MCLHSFVSRQMCFVRAGNRFLMVEDNQGWMRWAPASESQGVYTLTLSRGALWRHQPLPCPATFGADNTWFMGARSGPSIGEVSGAGDMTDALACSTVLIGYLARGSSSTYLGSVVVSTGPAILRLSIMVAVAIFRTLALSVTMLTRSH